MCDNTAMERLDLTLPTPDENLALDEALLDWAEAIDGAQEFLRVWEMPRPIVVVGRSTRVAHEVNVAACEDRGIPIFRRSSGGAAIVTGPGCLMYAVVLSYERRPELKDLGRAHTLVLGQLVAALRAVVPETVLVQHAGTSDMIAVEVGGRSAPRKFSGNSLRAKRSHLLYHGTLLYNFELSLIANCLQMPPRMPDYRGRRAHGDFVVNLPIGRQALVESLNVAWPSEGEVVSWPAERVADLVAERYSRASWNFEFG